VDLVKRRMAIAAQVGAKHFVIAGMHYNREETIRNHFREVADCAREHGMIVALETHPTLMHNADEILKTIDLFAHDAIRVNFDTANIYYHNESCIDMLKELERVKHLVGHVHLKDCRLQYHDWFFPALGKGKIDFPRTFEVLNGAGFFGPFSIEIEGIAGEKPNLETRQSWVRESVEYLTEIGVLQG
jgi:L-ribulose-5-phosphate 3-epimerase